MKRERKIISFIPYFGRIFEAHEYDGGLSWCVAHGAWRVC
jgi:hypothetical protein